MKKHADAICAVVVLGLMAWFLSWGPAKLGNPNAPPSWTLDRTFRGSD